MTTTLGVPDVNGWSVGRDERSVGSDPGRSGSHRAGRVGGMVTVGDKAPDFSLLDQDGETVSLSGLQGHKLLVYFYP